MPPTAGGQTAEELRRHHSPTKSRKLEIATSLRAIKSSIPFRRCAWLTATVFLQLLIINILFFNRAPLPPTTQRLHLKASSNFQPDDVCKFGRVYVYDLPPMLNKDLLENCNSIDPWSSRCTAVSNDGFGPPASGLDGVVPRSLAPAWYWTDMYASEVVYHGRMMNYDCRTADRDQASAFYIPFYAGLAVGKFLWFNYTSKDRDFHAVTMLDWVKNQPSWKKSNGSDHFIMLGRLTWDFRRLSDKDGDWGTKFIYMPLMKNVLRLSVERNPWDASEISVPYPTSFHPRSESDVLAWQDFVRVRRRSSQFSFVGATRKKIKNDFRAVLMEYCKNESSSCRVVDCSLTRCYDGAPAILEAFLDSDFCLQPKGDGWTRRSMFDCMLAGAIPVYFWRGSFEHQYEWHLPNAAKNYSVYIDNIDVRSERSIIKQVLNKYSREEVKKMRDVIIDFIPKFLYSRSNANLGRIKDAFDVAMEGVLRRFKQQKMGSDSR